MTPPGSNRVHFPAFCLNLVLAAAGFADPPKLLPPVVPADHSAARPPHPFGLPPGAEPPEYTPIPATNLPTVPVPEPLPASRASPPPEPTEAEGWKRDPRFARLTVDVRNGTAVIGGRAATHSAAWELAEEVREWAEVRRVVVGKVEVR